MFRLLLFSILIMGNLRAQKPEKGSSPDNPWNKEVAHGMSMELDYRMPPVPLQIFTFIRRLEV
jgi:hypothetical protein